MYGAISKFLNATGKIRRSFRIHLFRAVVEATLMYGGGSCPCPQQNAVALMLCDESRSRANQTDPS